MSSARNAGKVAFSDFQTQPSQKIARVHRAERWQSCAHRLLTQSSDTDMLHKRAYFTEILYKWPYNILRRSHDPSWGDLDTDILRKTHPATVILH